MECEKHGNQSSDGVCSKCLAPMCAECESAASGPVMCPVCRNRQLKTRIFSFSLVACLILGIAAYSLFFTESAKLARLVAKTPCNATANFHLIRHHWHAQDLGNALTVARTFLAECNEVRDIRMASYQINIEAGYMQDALVDLEKLIKADPYNKDYWAWKGQLLESLKQRREAILSYRQSLKIAPKLQQIPLNVVDLLQAEQRYCEAYLELKRYVAHYPNIGTHAKISAMRDDLLAKGKCSSELGQTSGVIGFPPGDSTIKALVRINGEHQANFIVDTGASMVSITPQLASKMGLKPEGKTIQLLTANGLSTGNLVTIDSISVAGISAKKLDVVILEQPLGGGLDGLLGMNFLARFELKIDSAKGKLILVDKFGSIDLSKS